MTRLARCGLVCHDGGDGWAMSVQGEECILDEVYAA